MPQSATQVAKATKVINRLRELKVDKQPWTIDYNLVSYYVMRRNHQFNEVNSVGNFTSRNIYDSKAIRAKSFLVSSLIGALWPSGSKTVKISPPEGMPQEVANSDVVKKFYEKCTRKVQKAIDDPEAGFRAALGEYMNDQVVFGISGVYVEDTQNSSMPCRFCAVDAKRLFVAEGPDGRVDTVYVEKTLTLRQLAMTYGEASLSEDRQKAYRENNNPEQKIQVLEAIEPRLDSVKDWFGSQDMPIASIHIDVASNHVLKESGYPEMPVFIARFWKYMNETYGRSPALECLSDILEINAMREALIIATEKTLDPPLALTDPDALGSGTVDTSAGAINIFNLSGKAQPSSHPSPLSPIFSVGDLEPTYKRLPEVEEIIEEGFMIDRLSDLNNDTRMTLGEANMRNDLREQSLNDVYARQIIELFNRLVTRVFNILLNAGLLGTIPGSDEDLAMQAQGQVPDYIPAEVLALVTKGEHVYEITFISPAARAMEKEELNGIQTIVTQTTEIAKVDVSILDYLNFDSILHRMQYLSGASSDILNSVEQVQQLRQTRMQQQQAQVAAEQKKLAAESFRAAGGGLAQAAKAGVDPATALQLASNAA